MQDMLIINEDNSHFFGGRSAGKMTLDGLSAFVDEYADSAVTHLFLCPNAMRASFRSQSRDAIWDTPDGKSPPHRWPVNARLLHERRLDAYRVWIARCREKHISPWLSMRMNDIHGVNDLKSFMHSTFWLKHPEFWRVPNGSSSPWQNRAMDYAHAEVRKHQMAFVRELLERYDPDGLELDWMRFGYHLTPGKERAQASILTGFVREVRQITLEWSRKRGHRILLGARVPAHPDAAAGLGMDGVVWAREGLVDMLVPCPFWSSSDFDIPVELWLARIGDAAEKVAVVPGLEYNARPWPSAAPVANDLASARGFAATCHARGADSIYLFNWMDSGTIPVGQNEYRQLIEKGLSDEVVLHARRRHPLCYRDTVPRDFPSGIYLPAPAFKGLDARIHIGPRPSTGQAWIIAGLAKRQGMKEAHFEATINGQPCPAAEDIKSTSKLGGMAARALRFECPLEALRDGYNQVHITQKNGTPEQQFVWAEIRIEP